MRHLIAVAACAVTGLGLVGCAAQPRPTPLAFDLRGTEPFWAVAIRGDRLSLSRPDRPPVEASARAEPAPGGALVWRAGTLSATVRPGPCSDGMSDIRYPMAAEVSLEGEAILRGCAQPAGAD